MNKYIYLFTLLVAALTGCASNVSPPPYRQHSTPEVKFYEQVDLNDRKYTRLGSIEGIDCSPTWLRFSNSGNALRELVDEAKKKGANGIVNASCRDSGVGPKLWCNNSATCNGEAISVQQ
ncbi:hypothetical protein [Candidatus Methylomirabilis sp.]|uniref:hypothetical protein n=1 Tax=Candidatus Methylomirabilis sp. TaxID=2032687 RepID=UPI003075FDAB|nr:hypothetical protein [Rhodocyclaceae bacterium]